MLAIGAAWTAPMPASATAMTYRIDRAQSHADFRVRMMWIRHISGRFNDIDGTVVFNKLRDTAVVRATVKVSSLTMSSERSRQRTLAPEFFDAARFPTIVFDSVPFTVQAMQTGGPLPGKLTLRGVTRPMTFELLPTHCPMRDAQPCQIQVQGNIPRSDFGMNGHSATVSDTVEFGLQIKLEPAAGR